MRFLFLSFFMLVCFNIIERKGKKVKIIRFNKISTKIRNSIHVLTYELLSDDVENGTTYGVVVMDQTSGDVEAVMDLTSLEYRANDFYQRLLKGRVTPLSLKSIAEDFVAE